MAATIPASYSANQPLVARFRQDRPCVAGASANDREFGLRGISELVNHTYAYRTQVLMTDWSRDQSKESIVDDDATSGAVTEQLEVHFGADVVDIRVVARVRNGRLILRINDGTNTINNQSSIIGTSFTTVTVDSTLVVTSGATGWVQLRWDNGGGASNPWEVLGYVVSELALTTLP